MKRKFLIIAIALTALTLLLFPACDSISADGSVKTLTKPYIAQYQCIEARYGAVDLLEYFDYIKITMLNEKELEMSYKFKDGEKQSARGNYSVNPETRELEGNFGILGYEFKEKVIVKNGQFVISKIIDSKELYLKFKVT